MKKLKLESKDNAYALMDDEDFLRLRHHRYHINFNLKFPFIYREIKKKGKVLRIRMARDILIGSKAKLIFYKNGNFLDNRKINMYAPLSGIIHNGKKECSSCMEIKSIDDFSRNRNISVGLNYICRPCDKRKRRADPKRPAWTSYKNALRRGDIVKSSKCQKCLRDFPMHNIDGHHYDGYEDPLKVIWLCRKCHGLAHRKNKSG